MPFRVGQTENQGYEIGNHCNDLDMKKGIIATIPFFISSALHQRYS